eukprot:3617162-Pyramimonas_sp.AAC.1
MRHRRSLEHSAIRDGRVYAVKRATESGHISEMCLGNARYTACAPAQLAVSIAAIARMTAYLAALIIARRLGPPIAVLGKPEGRPRPRGIVSH